jgi:hypothetical protein
MGTRSRIGMVNADGTIQSIYCHWDGGPAHHGPILLQHYGLAEVSMLMCLGDLSTLGPTIGTKHDFDSRAEGECTFYHRDRGDTDCESVTDATSEDFYETANGSDAAYLYLFTRVEEEPETAARWWVCDMSDDDYKWADLADLVKHLTSVQVDA